MAMNTSFINKMDVGSLLLYSSILEGMSGKDFSAMQSRADLNRGFDIFTHMKLDLPYSKEMSAYISTIVKSAPNTDIAGDSIKKISDSLQSLATAVAISAVGANMGTTVNAVSDKVKALT